MKTTALLITALLALTPAAAAADIYRYVGEDGTECFTDAPQNRGARLIIRDARRQSRQPAGAKVPRHLSATGIDGKLASKGAAPAAETPPGPLPVEGRITSLTGIRTDPIDGILRQHNGVDIAVPKGTPVRPVAPGTVVYSGQRPGYGNMVVVDHGSGLITVYAHHDSNGVIEGEAVSERTVIASSGSTGRSTGPHLHFEAWEEGVNITDRFAGTADSPIATARASTRREAPIRRSVQADGSLLFTNLPLHHP